MNIEEIKTLRGKISPLPWTYGSKMKFDGMDLKDRWVDGPTIRSNYTDDTQQGQIANADCEFVASSPEIVDYLLSIIEQDTRFFEKVEEWNSFSKENVLEASRRHMKIIRGN